MVDDVLVTQTDTHTLDIISSALSGNIPLEDENLSTFNLQAYEARCRANDKNTMRANVDKMLYIVDSGVMEESSGEKLSYGDIAERNLPRNQDDYNLVLSRMRVIVPIISKYLLVSQLSQFLKQRPDFTHLTFGLVIKIIHTTLLLY